ncbi:MAG TPA: S9 family peptidase, partial [Actinomycetota bacterium]|nr:S9 family peptidase [Actinomycetota bacterium]
MSSPEPSAYGSWASPISAEIVASGGVRLSQVAWSGDDLYWSEGRPSEGGRNVIVRRTADGETSDVIPAGFNARTLAHEYGGGAFWLSGPTLFFANFADQRLYRVDPGDEPRPITAEPPRPRAHRYADGVVTPDGATVICVRERHEAGGEVINELVALPADASAEPVILAGGHDFYSFPRLSPGGSRLAWTAWDHPQMPWDGTELWVAELGPTGVGALGQPRLVAGGVEESIFQPSFSPDGTLHFISDRSGWWNLYADRGVEAVSLAPEEAEFAGPQWVFGLSTYTNLADGSIACLVGRRGGTRLCRLWPGQPLADLDLAYRSYASLTSSGARLAFIAGSPLQAAAVIIHDTATGEHEVVRPSLAHEV